MGLTSVYVFITTEIGYEKDIFNKLKSIQDVKEAYLLIGLYDILVKLESDDMEYLKETIQSEIRCIDKIRSTTTMIELKPENK